MSTILGVATKLLDKMMVNYSQWHTKRAPSGKKVNYVEEISSLSDNIDMIMSMLASKHVPIDQTNVPLASLVAHEEQVDVNFVKNNFNNNAYRNNFGNNNYKPYPSNYGNSYNNNSVVSSDLESMFKDFITSQKALNKIVEEKLEKLDNLIIKVDSLSHEIDFLKINFCLMIGI